MKLLRSRGLVAVAMAVTLLAFEAVAVVGATRAIAWWESPRPAVLARAGVTVWTALAGSVSRALVSATMPAALTAMRTTNRWGRAVAAALPGARHGCSRPAIAAWTPRQAVVVARSAPTVAVALAVDRQIDLQLERHVVVSSAIRKKCTVVRREIRAPRTRSAS